MLNESAKGKRITQQGAPLLRGRAVKIHHLNPDCVSEWSSLLIYQLTSYDLNYPSPNQTARNNPETLAGTHDPKPHPAATPITPGSKELSQEDKDEGPIQSAEDRPHFLQRRSFTHLAQPRTDVGRRERFDSATRGAGDGGE